METRVFFSIEDYMSRFVSHIKRPESRDLAHGYVVGLMMDGERKSVEPMSERLHASERGMQRLLTEAKWNHENTFREYRRQMLNETNDPQGVLLIDDTSFIKSGNHSVCVSRQYCGALGKVANCQIAVSMSYVGQGFAWPYAMELFVPKSWDNFEDCECLRKRAKTRMPETAHYREKWQIALELVDLADSEGVSHRAVLADSWYGNIANFRRGLVERQKRYVVGVNSNTLVFLEAPLFEGDSLRVIKPGPRRKYPRLSGASSPIRLCDLGKCIKEDDWEHLEIRKDSKGKPLIVEAVSRRVFPAEGYRQGNIQEEVWLIVERRGNDKESELRYFFSNMPQDMPTLEMVRLFHERFWIEQGYQQLKEELGLDHHEGRSWLGWRRHVLLVFLAFGYLTLQRIQEKKHFQQLWWNQRIQKAMVTVV